ncbi:hypothetical protein G6F68_019606 [Rhizopus microsporus]|nr:hypothetical protein G6F68_019606 [Rhizopus microsporus]
MRRYLQPSTIIGAATIGLQQGAPAQVVGQQRLVRFGHAQFPRHAGIADRADRRGTGAAVMAGNGDQVRTGLDHAGGNRADAGMADQLHRHQRGRMAGCGGGEIRVTPGTA